MPRQVNAPKLWPALPGEPEPHGRRRAVPRRRAARRSRPPPARPPPGGGCRSGSCPRTAARSRGTAASSVQDLRVERHHARPVVPGDGAAEHRRAAPEGTATGRWVPAASERSSICARGTSGRSTRSQQVVPPDDLVQAADAHAGQNPRTSSATKREVGDHLLRRALELGPQVLALGGDAGGAGVDVALPRHGAAHRHQRRGAEAVALGAEQRGDDHVAAGLEAAVGADLDPVPQPVPDQDRAAPRRVPAPRASRRA